MKLDTVFKPQYDWEVKKWEVWCHSGGLSFGIIEGLSTKEAKLLARKLNLVVKNFRTLWPEQCGQ